MKQLFLDAGIRTARQHVVSTVEAGLEFPDVPAAQKEKLGITDRLLRLSVGIENPDDIIRDLQQAFENAGR